MCEEWWGLDVSWKREPGGLSAGGNKRALKALVLDGHKSLELQDESAEGGSRAAPLLHSWWRVGRPLELSSSRVGGGLSSYSCRRGVGGRMGMPCGMHKSRNKG